MMTCSFEDDLPFPDKLFRTIMGFFNRVPPFEFSFSFRTVSQSVKHEQNTFLEPAREEVLSSQRKRLLQNLELKQCLHSCYSKTTRASSRVWHVFFLRGTSRDDVDFSGGFFVGRKRDFLLPAGSKKSRIDIPTHSICSQRKSGSRRFCNWRKLMELWTRLLLGVQYCWALCTQ